MQHGEVLGIGSMRIGPVKTHMIKTFLLGLLAMVVGIATAHAGSKH